MSNFVELLSKYFPKIAVIATNTVFVIFLILNIADDFDKIKVFCKRLFDVGKQIDKLYYTKVRKKYDEILASGDFITWQYRVIEKIYLPLVKEKERQGLNINITHLDIGLREGNIKSVKQDYEAVTIHMK